MDNDNNTPTTNVITRFAPSPTGLLHIGNIRTALINWLYARSLGGQFILRIDDTDLERSKVAYEEQIIDDLKWLGLNWDHCFRQSARFKRYEEAKMQLISSGRLYPCYETTEELAIQKKSLLSRNLPPIYNRASLHLSQSQKMQYEHSGVRPYWRFLLNDSPVVIHDKIRGTISFDKLCVSDPVLIRTDGTMTYTLCSVVDDIDYGITDIIRGEDHLTNSAVHVQIFEALGMQKMPNFAHLCLLEAKTGEISKRTGGFAIQSLKEYGIEAMTINSFLAKIGTSDPVEACTTLDGLLKGFELSKFGKTRILYDQQDIMKLNAKIVHNIDYATIAGYLHALGLDMVDENFWETVKRNLNTVKEVKEWWTVCNTAVQPLILDKDFTIGASRILSEMVWDQDIWRRWIAAIQYKTGRKGKALYAPIRAALTGVESGPELKHILPLLGYKKTYGRLNGEVI